MGIVGSRPDVGTERESGVGRRGGWSGNEREGEEGGVGMRGGRGGNWRGSAGVGATLSGCITLFIFGTRTTSHIGQGVVIGVMG